MQPIPSHITVRIDNIEKTRPLFELQDQVMVDCRGNEPQRVSEIAAAGEIALRAEFASCPLEDI